MRTWIRCNLITDYNRPEIQFLNSLYANMSANQIIIDSLKKLPQYQYCDQKLLNYFNHNKAKFKDKKYCNVFIYYEHPQKTKNGLHKNNDVEIRFFYSQYGVPTFSKGLQMYLSYMSMGRYRLYKNKIYKLI